MKEFEDDLCLIRDNCTAYCLSTWPEDAAENLRGKQRYPSLPPKAELLVKTAQAAIDRDRAELVKIEGEILEARRSGAITGQ